MGCFPGAGGHYAGKAPASDSGGGGALEYVDSIFIIGVDSSGVSFGAGGDGVNGTALDGDADGMYLIRSLWKSNPAAASMVYLEPNGIAWSTAGMQTRWTEQTTLTYYGTNAGMALHRTTSASDVMSHGESSFIAKRSVAPTRMLYGREAIEQNNIWPTMATRIFSAGWMDNATLITTLGIVPGAALGLKAGSEFHLYKQSMPNA